jgi:hypothetical protein
MLRGQENPRHADRVQHARPITEKIKAHHLGREAVLYVRSSCSRQVLHNLDSRALQYFMRERIGAHVWSDVETMDDDLKRAQTRVRQVEQGYSATSIEVMRIDRRNAQASEYRSHRR